VPEELSRQVAARVRRLMEEHGLSGNALSKAAGISQSSISRKLAGTHPFDVDDLAAIGRVLDVRPADLLSSTGD